jgi:hypothetical protein
MESCSKKEAIRCFALGGVVEILFLRIQCELKKIATKHPTRFGFLCFLWRGRPNIKNSF